MIFSRCLISLMGFHLLACCFLISIATFGCLKFEQTNKMAVITVGTRAVTSEELKKDIEFISALTNFRSIQNNEIKSQLIEHIINHYLILEYGKNQGISINENDMQLAVSEFKREYTEESFQDALLRGYVNYDQWHERLKEQLLVKKIIKSVIDTIPSPSYQVIKEYFEANTDQFRSPRMVKFRQIVTMTEEEASDILKRLQNGENMSDLALEYSTTPEAEKGGEVGWVAFSDLEESMEEILSSLPEGKISPVKKTPYGYHIFEVLSVKEEGIKDLTEVVKEIESKLLNEQCEIFLQKWLKELRSQFTVKINQEMLTKLKMS